MLPQIQYIDTIVGLQCDERQMPAIQTCRKKTCGAPRPSTLQGTWSSRSRYQTRASNTVVSSTDSKLSMKKVATSCFTQAVAEPITAGLEKLQARLDEINTKLDGTKKDVSDRRCKDNTSNDPFSRCKSVQQFGCR